MGLTRISLGRVFHAESANYVFLLGITMFMVVFGLIMVLSSSSVDSHVADNNFFAKFMKQGMFAMIGVPLMLIASRVPPRFWKKWAWAALFGACGLQVLVVATPLGVGAYGNKNWLQLGPLPALQPSEAIKVAMVLWLGMFFAKKHDRLNQWRYTLLPAVLVMGVAIALVLAGSDLGTVLIMAGILLGALFFAGVPIRQLVVTFVVGAGVALLFVVTSANRMGRIMSFLQPHTSAYMSEGWQTQNGLFALASGGVFGVGLGNSHSKWSWLPSADTDFIFAIIGEELGLIGAVLVLALFVLLTIAFLRIYHSNSDPGARVTTAAVMVWLIYQGLVNIGVVLGVLPVLGVPLPLISSGGTALISSLVAIGIVLSFARDAPARKASVTPRPTAAARRNPRR
jgi:cell division protein FtsW